jgi:PIN domain nuclease of toxin-antitoxin system
VTHEVTAGHPYLLWALSEPNRLSPKQVIAMEDPTNTVYVSSISITEIAIKASLGKLELVFDPLDAAEKSGFEMLDFSAKDALLLKDLPFHHRDPFDRMLITQAISRKLIIATQDSIIDRYDCQILK